MKKQKEGYFKLIKKFANYRLGRVFDSYGGLIKGICHDKEKISFDNKEYFKLIK